MGALGALSFHETKNITCGEGGALLVNDARFVERAEILREKGTNRSKFFRGEVDKYTWVDIGSSYLPSEISAAFLAAQMEEASRITAERLALWNRYHDAFADIEADGHARRPVVPGHCVHNAHMYYLLLKDFETRRRFIESMKAVDIHPVFHYIPLHGSPAGKRYARVVGSMEVTESAGERLVRLPLWLGGMDQDRVIEAARKFFR